MVYLKHPVAINIVFYTSTYIENNNILLLLMSAIFPHSFKKTCPAMYEIQESSLSNIT
jgi:hypothetical protein